MVSPTTTKIAAVWTEKSSHSATDPQVASGDAATWSRNARARAFQFTKFSDTGRAAAGGNGRMPKSSHQVEVRAAAAVDHVCGRSKKVAALASGRQVRTLDRFRPRPSS